MSDYNFNVVINKKKQYCRSLAKNELYKFVNKPSLALNSKNFYIIVGEGYMRVIIACARKTLKKAINQLAKVYNKIFKAFKNITNGIIFS